MKTQQTIPDSRYICKYYYHCQCGKDTVGGAYCTVDIMIGYRI